MSNFYKITLLFSIALLFQFNNGYAQWKKSLILGDGQANVYCLYENNDTIYAGTSNGIFYSTDLGISWSYLNLSGREITSIIKSGNKVFAFSDLEEGLYYSADNGSNWKYIGSNIQNKRCFTYCNEKLYLGVYGNTNPCVYVSSDNGVNWDTAGLRVYYVRSLFSQDGIIYAGTENGIFSSSDGITWNSITPDEKNITFTQFWGTDSAIFAGSNNSDLYLSKNKGKDWSKATISTDIRCQSFIYKGKEIFAGGYTGVYRSIDDGQSWEQVNSGLINLYGLNVYSLLRKDSVIYAGTAYKGVFSLNINDTTWKWKSNGLLSFGTVNAFTSIGETLFMGCDQYGLFVSTDKGSTWHQKNNSPSDYVTSLITNGSQIIAGAPNGLFISNDMCNSWVTISGKNSVALGIVKNNIYVCIDTGLYVSNNNGANWTFLSSGSIYKPYLKIFESEDSILFAATGQALGLFRSTDGGKNWNAANNGMSDKYGLNITSIKTDSNLVYLASWGVGVYNSTNNGMTWNELNNGLSDLFVIPMITNGPDIYVGTVSSGVFHSSNYGANWVMFNPGIYGYDHDIRSFYINGEYLYTGTLYGSVYWRKLSDTTTTGIDEKEDLVPTKYSLSQNYPNPFNPTTIINYSLPKPGYVTIKVYDILGREVRTLVNADKSAGNYSVQFNGSNLSSGIYFYRLQSSNFSQTKKLILLK